MRQAAHPGGPHPYLIGEGEARAALDSVVAFWCSALDLDYLFGDCLVLPK